ncbi:MAG: haloacid dehalogenase-like hydrolase [Clostridia bacterium]|nr:haloacid dehalogenase-like hydrolase [Clostridia bacterium]
MTFFREHFKPKNVTITILILACLVTISFYACTPGMSNEASANKQAVTTTADPLPSWNNTAMKTKILNFITSVTDSSKKSFVPEKDRIATLDMDGTIICEKPLWLEMNVAQNYLYEQSLKNPALLKQKIYAEAYNYYTAPDNQKNIQALENDAVDIMTQAFYPNYTQDDYVNYVKNYMANTKNTKYNITLKQTFFKPMLELITLLEKNKFQVYIVSGSEVGLIWGACDDTLNLPRDHEIGTLLKLSPKFYTVSSGLSPQFIRETNYIEPRNLQDVKAVNIYYRTGKKPIFAFGNTADDYQMLTSASTNTYPNMSCLLVHDDEKREYNYPDSATKLGIENTAKENKWNLVSIKENFKTVFNK